MARKGEVIFYNMFPFIYYIDCDGNLWVPCGCRCSDGCHGNGTAEIVYVNGRREYRERVLERRDCCYDRRDSCCDRGDCCERRECIRPASEGEKALLDKEQAYEKMIAETLEAVKRLEKLHEAELAPPPAEA